MEETCGARVLLMWWLNLVREPATLLIYLPAGPKVAREGRSLLLLLIMSGAVGLANQ